MDKSYDEYIASRRMPAKYVLATDGYFTTPGGSGIIYMAKCVAKDSKQYGFKPATQCQLDKFFFINVPSHPNAVVYSEWINAINE